MASKFPNVIAAIEAREERLNKTEGSDLWAIGDALIKDIKRLDRDARGHDASRAQIEKCAEELESRGFKSYTTHTLSYIFATAEAFPKSKRNPKIAFHAHRVAGNPEILDWIEESAKGEKVSQPLVEEMVGLWQERHKTKLKEEEEKTGIRQKPPAKRNLPAPNKEDIPVVAKELSLLRFSREAKRLGAEAKRLADETTDEIEGVMLDVNPTFIALATEASLEATKSLGDATDAWRNVSNVVRKTTNQKRGHLVAVGE